MMGSWTNFLALIKGADPLTHLAFNNKVLHFNEGVMAQFELQLKINDGLRKDIELLGANSKRVELALLKRIEALEQRL